MSKGAEAEISLLTSSQEKAVLKERLPKKYRERLFDESIRERRNRQEAALLRKARAKLRVPKLLHTGRFSIVMEYVEGKRPQRCPALAREMGGLLKELHSLNIIHNDFTPANVIVAEAETCVIDFGLGFYSQRTEDKANDLFTTAYSLRPFDEEVISEYGDEKVIKRYYEIKKRARYMGSL